LARTFGCARFVYNWGLRLRSDAYRAHGEHLFYRDTRDALTQLKQDPEYCWLNEVSSVPPQQALRHLDKAFRSFFDGRAKYPTFKKKHGRQSAEFTEMVAGSSQLSSGRGMPSTSLDSGLEQMYNGLVKRDNPLLHWPA